MLWFIIGLFVGSIAGFGLAALCIVAKQADELSEKQFQMSHNQTIK